MLYPPSMRATHDLRCGNANPVKDYLDEALAFNCVGELSTRNVTWHRPSANVHQPLATWTYTCGRRSSTRVVASRQQTLRMGSTARTAE